LSQPIARVTANDTLRVGRGAQRDRDRLDTRLLYTA
jgi:hypothetical protein